MALGKGWRNKLGKNTAGQSWRGLTETETDRPQQRQAGGWKEN